MMKLEDWLDDHTIQIIITIGIILAVLTYLTFSKG